MKRTVIFLLAACAMLISGCTSLQGAGIASYSVKPMLLNGEQICCEVTMLNGKEYAELKVDIVREGGKWSVHLDEKGVAAFQGQSISASAVGGVVSEAAKISVASALAPLLPMLAPALASPGIGAAAAGAAAAVGVQKLGAP